MKAKKFTAIAILAIFTIVRVAGFGLGVTYAAPDRPDSPDAPAQEEEQQTETSSDSPSEPDLPGVPDNTHEEDSGESDITTGEVPTESETQATELENNQDEVDSHVEAPEVAEAPEVDNEDSDTGALASDGQLGDATIETGEANASGSIQNSGNDNIANGAGYEEGLGGISIYTEGNGTGSENTGSISLADESQTLQDNKANLDNSLKVDSNSGNNSASKNVGNSEIKTGEANTTGTITNFVNTNIAGAVVSEFNIEDDQLGDLVLDYASNCISGCGAVGGVSLANQGNGANSENSSEVDLITSDLTFQNNDGTLENELILTANTGNNTADNNTGGDSKVTSGDANVSGSVMNFLNNNIAGNIVYGVVNIFGDLVGDIIVPDEYASYYSALPVGDINLANTENGSGSDNEADLAYLNSDEYYQFNEADIVNNLILDANTGGNSTRDNTGGDNSIETGDVDIDASILNIANTNIVGGNWWIVLVNEAGNWIGKIFAPAGSSVGNNYASAPGTSTSQSDNGAVTVTNDGNGSGSENSGDVSIANQNQTVQNNKGSIVNNINLSANTGNNSASRNTGGESAISTGDANIQFNLINFINNNIANANVFLTVVNVFGSWVGDFVAPGGSKPEAQAPSEPALGGTAEIPNSHENDQANNSSSSNSSNSSGNSSDQSSSGNSSSGSSNSSVLAASTFSPKFTNAPLTGKIASGVTDQKEDGLALSNGSKAVSAGNESSKTRVNLAWGLAVIPLYFVIKFARRRLMGA